MAIIGNGITTGAAGLDEMITVSDAQPTVPSNKVWVKETPSEIVIPTAEELSDVKNAIDDLELANEIIYVNVNDLERGSYSEGIGKTDNTKRLRMINSKWCRRGTTVSFNIGELYFYVYEFDKSAIDDTTVSLKKRGWVRDKTYIVENDCWLYLLFANGASAAASTNIYLDDFNGCFVCSTQIKDSKELSEYVYTPNLIDKIPHVTKSYVKYVDGALYRTGAYSGYYYFRNNGYRYIRVTTYALDTAPAAIAFYSTDTISAQTYLKDESVQSIAGWGTYIAEVPQNCELICVDYRDDYASGSGNISIELIGSDIAANTYENISIIRKYSETALGNISRTLKPCVDHLFVSDTADNITIPHESLYHVRISKSLGFDCIEANPASTSDGVYIVNHLSSGKFGRFFVHVDGTTDISDIKVSEVTWDWIAQNVRYRTNIPKYRTVPCTLEEFLHECRQQNIYPMLGECDDPNVVQIANSIMGRENYIAYKGTRSLCPSAVIMDYANNLTDKNDILAFCETYGRPFIYSMLNPTDFTTEELQDVIDLLHQHGYWIATSYVDEDWYKYEYLGFDYNFTQKRINRIANGNICNLNSINGFSAVYTYTNATETDNGLYFSSDGTITPVFSSGTVLLGGIDLEVSFTGSITIPKIGRHGMKTYSSDGDIPVFVATPLLNESNAIVINVANGTTIKDIYFKASTF